MAGGNFVSNTKVNTGNTPLTCINQMEANLLAENNNIGINITEDLIIDPAKYQQAGYLAELSKRDPDFYKSAAESLGVSVPDVIYAANKECGKPEAFADRVNAFPNGCHFRVHPFPPASPFSLEQGVDSNGQVCLDNNAMNQVRALKDKAVDMTVVIAPYTKANGCHVPVGDEKDMYTDLCRSFIKESGFDVSRGKGLVLELGNEMNLHQGSDKSFQNNEVFPRDKVSPEQYADWYYDTVTELKKEFPDLKCSIAGTAFYDSKFVKDVVSELEKKPDGLNTVDVISFHPYRNDFSSGTAVVKDGVITDKQMSYEKQERLLDKIAEHVSRCRTDGGSCEMTVGEISYCQDGEFGKSVDFEQMSVEANSNRDVKRYMWPTESMLSADIAQRSKQRIAQAQNMIQIPQDGYDIEAQCNS